MYKDVHFYRASALFSAVSLYLLRLFSKGFGFPLPARIAVSGKTSGKAFFFNKQFSLADCCILFTITIKKTKCSTALASKLRLSAPLHHTASIFLPLLFCSSGVFFSVPTRTSVVLSRSTFCSAQRAIKPVQGCTGLITAPKNRRCIICAAKRISASIAVRGILPSLFLFIPHIRPQLVL